MSSDALIIIVTGANRGIGHALVQLFATHPPATPAIIYACARKPSSETGSNSSKDVTVEPTQLDVSSASSIQAFAKDLQSRHPNSVDIVVNNAGVNYTGNHSISNAKNCVAVNVDGMLEMSRAFGPLMRRPGRSELNNQSRMINISSAACSLAPGPFGSYGPKIASRIREAATLKDFTSLRDDYVNAVEADTDNEEAGGWPKHNSYKVSKALVNVLTRVSANEPSIVSKGEGHTQVNCCCPGWVNTDMGSMMGPAPKTPEEGARVPYVLATGNLKGVSGEYWALPGVSQKGTDGLGVHKWMS